MPNRAAAARVLSASAIKARYSSKSRSLGGCCRDSDPAAVLSTLVAKKFPCAGVVAIMFVSPN
jgi:hypothetical protein